jgi:periplasmic protein TonB
MRIGIRLFSLALLFVLAGSVLSAQTPQPVDVAVDSTRTYPDHDEFVAVDEEPKFDSEELYRNLKYPEIARRKSIEGLVLIQVLIDEEGRVVKYLILQSVDNILNESAKRAVLATSFTAAKRGGKPIATWIALPVQFRLR